MTLAKLHPDIMRNIILIELESVDELRLISKSWNDAIIDLFNNRLFLEGLVLEKFDGDAKIKTVADVLREKQFGLANVAPDFKRSKGIANKNSIFLRNLPWDIPTQTAPQARPRDDILLGNRIKFVDKFKRSNENISGEEEITEKVQHSLESLQRMLLRISGIEMYMFIAMTATDLKRIAKAMRNLPVNDLMISVRICDEESRAAILEIMKYAKIKKLSLYAHYYTRKNLNMIQGEDEIAFYAFWATTARQMINNGLEEFAFGRKGFLMMQRLRNEDSQAQNNDEARLNVSF